MGTPTKRQRRKETGPEYAARTRAMYERVKKSGEDVEALRGAYDKAIPFMDYMRGYVSLWDVLDSDNPGQSLFFLPEELEDPKRFQQVLILARFSERIHHDLDRSKRHNISDWSTDVTLAEVLLSRKHDWILVIGRKDVERFDSLDELVKRARVVLPKQVEYRSPDSENHVDSGNTFSYNIPLVIADGLIACWQSTMMEMRGLLARTSYAEEEARTGLFEVTNRWANSGVPPKLH